MPNAELRIENESHESRVMSHDSGNNYKLKRRLSGVEVSFQLSIIHFQFKS